MAVADDLVNTPGGCRIFRGRCFASLEFDENLREVRAEFTDGSIYLYEGVPKRIADSWFERLDPGCFFNSSGKPWPFTRIKPPR